MDYIAQGVIAVLGVSAIWFSQDSLVSRQRIAPILGLLAQPAWFYTAIINEQYGLFVLSFLYSYSWWRGFKRHWL